MKVRMRFYTRINEQGCVETACIVWYEDKVGGGVFMGNSIQHPNDKHDEYLGRKLAFRQALKSVEGENYRHALRHHFKCHYKPESDRQKGFPTHFDGFPIDPPNKESNCVGKDLNLRLRKITANTNKIINAIKDIDRLMGGGCES